MEFFKTTEYQSGRSMVEMLGVLAIIGVLSIGGIAGYTVAMNYYKANEILADVNTRAVLVAGNIAANGSALANREYELDMEKTNDFGQDVTAVSQGDHFTIDITNVPAAVCRQIINQAEDIDIVIGTTIVESPDDCGDDVVDISIPFANDLDPAFDVTSASATLPFNPKTDYKECSGEGYTEECNGGYCLYGICLVPEGNVCETDSDCAGTKTPYCSEYSKKCVQCTQNSHCGKGYFCGGSGDDCEKSNYNTCRKSEVEKTYTTGKTTYYLSSKQMPWWDAKNYCESLGKSLVPASAFNTAAPEDSGGDASYPENSPTKTGLAAELSGSKALGMGDPVWSSLSYSCYAYHVYLSSGEIKDCHLVSNYYRALCR